FTLFYVICTLYCYIAPRYFLSFPTRRSSDLHRDDLIFYINGKDVKLFGSQGQQRTTALSLKLAEIDLIHEQMKEYPILLLDDVLSELDDFRQSHLLSTIQGKVQTFVSTTTVDGIFHETLEKASVYVVDNGTVSTYQNEKE